MAIALAVLAAPAEAQRPPRGGGAHNRFPLERWNRMSPEQRERTLKELPPERRQKTRERIEHFNKMSESERERLTRRWERFAGLSPEKQELVRRQLREFRNVPDGRRPQLAREFRRLRGLSEAERKTRMESEEFRNMYSGEEREMLRDLADNLSPAPK